jgi:hypothetical protein
VKQVFADTLYWIAIFLPGDPWASTARAVDLSGASLVTTEEVLSEFLTAVSARAERYTLVRCCGQEYVRYASVSIHVAHPGGWHPLRSRI